MPSLPPFFIGKISGVLTISISDISWFQNDVKGTYIQFEWTGSHENHKLLISKYSKINYDIRTSYKSFLNYLSTCKLICTVKNNENKIFAHSTIKNISISQNNQLIRTLPLMNNEKTVGTLKLCFNLQTFNDTSFDNYIKSLQQNGIQNKVSNNSNDKEFYYSEILKTKKMTRPFSSLSIRTNKSKEELTSDYLMGKDMAPEEEKEALDSLKTMPSAESIVCAAEKQCIYSPSLSPLHIQGNTKIMTSLKPDVKNIKKLPTHTLKKPCIRINKCELQADFLKPLNKAPVPKDDIFLHLSIISINVYRTIKSLQNYINSTYIVQCLKDQEPYKLLRFMSRHVDDNVVKFNSAAQSSRLEGCTAKGITIKAYVRLLSERSPILLGETKQMVDWTGFSSSFGDPRLIKVPIWNNDKITGHLSLSFSFSKTPIIEKYQDNFSEEQVENLIDIEYPEKQIHDATNTKFSKSVASVIKKNEKSYIDDSLYPLKDQINLYNRLYPVINKDFIDSQLLLDEQPNKESNKMTKEKETQTYFNARQFNKSVQTFVQTFNVAVQVDNDELEDPLDKTICCDVQNIFRCTHEFTFYVEKKCDSTFNFVTYQFPECLTTNTGKVITCHKMFRTYGNTNILHLITLPTTIPLDTYFYNNYKRAAIVLNLYKNDENVPVKISLLVSHLINMANTFETSYITKDLILNKNLSIHELSHDNVHIKIHYKKVFHTFPSPEEQFKPSNNSHKSQKKNSKIIVDLTESDSEETSVNKTYTLYKHNDRIVGVTAENSTQTDLIFAKTSSNCETQTDEDMRQQCITIDDSHDSIGNKQKNVKQIDTIVKNQPNRTNIIQNREKNKIIDKFNDSDILKTKLTIVGGYNLPMVRLNGDIVPSAPTTYVIMKNFDGNSFCTSSIVQQVNPIWNSEWTVIIPKNKLIEGKWLILELWCKKYKNEYAGHDVKRDTRLGFIIINSCALENSFDQDGRLYDVISETEEHRGQVKIKFSSVNFINSQVNDNFVSRPIDINTIFKANKIDVQKSSNNLINDKMIGSLQIENDYIGSRKSRNPITTRTEQHCDYVDLTKDSPQKLSKTPLLSTVAESSRDSFIDDDNIFDMGTISSVTSWTSSSDDILCSNNDSRIVNNVLNNATKMSRIKQIIQS